jgi:hypothetical protein
MGKMFFNILATFAEFESDLIRLRTREGMKIARAKGRLRGKQPKLSDKQQKELGRMHVVSIPDAGHVSWVDDSNGVAKELRDAFESGSHCGKDYGIPIATYARSNSAYRGPNRVQDDRHLVVSNRAFAPSARALRPAVP